MSSNLADRKLISRVLGRTVEAQGTKRRVFVFQDVLEDTETPAGQPVLISNPEDEVWRLFRTLDPGFRSNSLAESMDHSHGMAISQNGPRV